MIKNDPVAKLRLGKEHNVHDWMRSGYDNLISSVDIGIKELSQDPCHMDWETTATILETRRRSVVGIFLTMQKSKLCGKCVYNPASKAQVGLCACRTSKTFNKNFASNITTTSTLTCGKDDGELELDE